MKKLNEMIEEAEALDDNFKISKDILLIRLKDCKEELEKQLTLTDVSESFSKSDLLDLGNWFDGSPEFVEEVVDDWLNAR
jgi:hypothetical protein